MKIELHKIKVREVVNEFTDSAEDGVVAYGGKLDVRPRYQREFVYKNDQRDAVLETTQNGFPLNVMYWMVKDNGYYEVLDGQQRTISLGQYVNGDFSICDRYFHNLHKEDQDQILNYELMIYFCEGTDKERLDWFKTVNIAGEKLLDQELRNAVYTGPWLSDAKLKFSKTGCAAYNLATDGGSLIKGSPIRQDYLEKVLTWINNGEVSDYMAKHQHDKNADSLWAFFQDVIDWVRKIFPNYRKKMKGVEWGFLFLEFKDKKLDPVKLEFEVIELIQDEEVTHLSGIYSYVLTRDKRHLSLRGFDEKTKSAAYERQGGICVKCQEKFKFSEMEADHITPWHEGGKTTSENCQMLCKRDNRIKSDK